MNSITEIFTDGKQIFNKISNFIEEYIGGALLRKCGITKLVDRIKENGEYDYGDNPITRLIGDTEHSKVLECCVSAKQLLADKIVACFVSTSAYMLFKTGAFAGSYKKDTFYRFDRLPKANWERLQLETARNVVHDIESQTTADRLAALVFDDSLYLRTGGKGTDLVAKVYDHNDHKMKTGYRMMTGGWTNGEVFIPFAQALLTTRDEGLMVGTDERVDGRTLRGKRRKVAKSKGTDVVREMIKSARNADIPFTHVMFDTWFSSPSQLVAIKDDGADVIAMIKKNSTKYDWVNPATGETLKLDVKEIYGRNKKRRGRSRYLLSVEVNVSDGDGRSIPARLVYARNRNNRKDWVCFVCTDMSMAEEDVLQAYTMRWQIETYFKMSKSYLKLRTECHSTSYDAVTSHMVVVALRYMMLAVERWRNTDNRSIEEIFYCIGREVIRDSVNMAIVVIIDALLESVRQCFCATGSQIDNLVSVFISKLPDEWKCRFELPASVPA